MSLQITRVICVAMCNTFSYMCKCYLLCFALHFSFAYGYNSSYITTCIPYVETGCVGNGNIQIQFDNSSYCTDESTGELCTVFIVVGCVKEMFNLDVFLLPTQPVSAEGMHVAI